MDSNLSQLAISAALSGKWQEAIDLNKKILSDTPNDTDALNRLARGLSEIGKIDEARLTARKVLKIDPFNSIAQKSLNKWENFSNGKIQSVSSLPTNPQAFLEEPGKTKIISLLKTGNIQTLAKLDAGDEVKLNCSKHKTTVTTQDSVYIGTFPDDVSARLSRLIASGNKYQVLIKSVEGTSVKVFVRETKRDSKMSDIPSFPSEKMDYISFTPPELVHKKEDIHVVTNTDEAE